MEITFELLAALSELGNAAEDLADVMHELEDIREDLMDTEDRHADCLAEFETNPHNFRLLT